MMCWPQESRRREGSFRGRKEGEQDQGCTRGAVGVSAGLLLPWTRDPGLRAPDTHTPHTQGHLLCFPFTLFCFPFFNISARGWTVGRRSWGSVQQQASRRMGWARDLSLSPSPPPQGRTLGSRTGWPWSPPSPGDPLPHSPPGTPLPLLIARSSTFCHEPPDAGAGRRNSFRFLLPGCEL